MLNLAGIGLPRRTLTFSNNAWLLLFYNGDGNNDVRDYDNHVRLVRSGQ